MTIVANLLIIGLALPPIYMICWKMTVDAAVGIANELETKLPTVMWDPVTTVKKDSKSTTNAPGLLKTYMKNSSKYYREVWLDLTLEIEGEVESETLKLYTTKKGIIINNCNTNTNNSE